MNVATNVSTSPYTEAIDDALWEPCASDLKTYRHFDALISPEAVKRLVRDPGKIAAHTFRPLLHFEKKWRRPPKNGKPGKEKVRPIRYACRKDAYIYKHYRSLLSAGYERRLLGAGLQGAVLAYRRIPVESGSGACKSNIHFADDAFKCIEALGRCCAVAIDLSEFFDSIDHNLLRKVWLSLLGLEALPCDHAAVFKSITNYRFVDLTSAFIALGYSSLDANGKVRFLRRPSDIPIQLCSPKVFREKIVNAGLVQKQGKGYGIPQGLPISDLLANAYLFDFDVAMLKYAKSKGGHYFRYSDDILILLPGDGRAAKAAINRAQNEIAKCGSALKINSSKTEIVCYKSTGAGARCYSMVPAGMGARRVRVSENEGLSYLGFRFDGECIFIRNSTITNIRGKIARTCKAVASRHIKMHAEKDLEWLIGRIPVSTVLEKYLKVEDFDKVVFDARQSGQSFFESLTFWSYAKRAEKIFGRKGAKILKQLRGLNPTIRSLIEREVRQKYAARLI